MSTSTKNRATFHSRLGFILVSAGCAVGLGNVWKFPYICGENGGGAFLIIYLLCLLLLGLPIVICEFAIGRGSRRSISQALNILEQPGSRWHITKYAGIAGNYLLMMFYTMVAGWMLYYAFLYGSGKITAVSAEETSGFFSRMLDNPGLMILFAAIVIALCIGICALGLQNGIEKITKVMMMLLIVLMLVLVVNSLRLKGAGEGLKYFLVPSFSRLKENGYGSVAFAAMTHAFFTLSVGIGAMEIFGSYLKKGRRITGEAINVVVLDTCVAIMAGLIIIPACFSYGVQPDAGPSLLFITLPNVFHHMVGGRIWGCCFFVFMSFAALSTVIAVFENIITMTVELGSWTRKKSLLVNLVLIFVLSLPAILGFNLLSGFQPFRGWFQRNGSGGLFGFVQHPAAGFSGVCAVLRPEKRLGLGKIPGGGQRGNRPETAGLAARLYGVCRADADLSDLPQGLLRYVCRKGNGNAYRLDGVRCAAPGGDLLGVLFCGEKACSKGGNQKQVTCG